MSDTFNCQKRGNSYLLLVCLCVWAASLSVTGLCATGPSGFAALDGDGIHFLEGGTTGGAGGIVVTVQNLTALSYYAGQTIPYIIQVKGQLESATPGRITVKSHKTIIGLGNDAALVNQGLNLNGVHNIIIKNLTIRDYYMMGDYDGKANDFDAIALRNVHHVWIDHCHLSRTGDGLLDMSYASGYVTVSRTIFSYHNKTSLTDGNKDPLNIGKYTYDHCWFNNTTQRNAASEWADVHAFNCYFLGVRSYCMNARSQTRILLENSYFKQSRSPYYGENGGQVQVSGNVLDQISGLTVAGSHSFVPPYAYVLDDAADVPAIVTAAAGPGGFADHIDEQTIRINFLPNGATEVRGYLPDYGYTYGNRGNGYTYGWNASNIANAIWRLTTSYKDEVSQVPVDADFRRNSIITMDNGARKWEIGLPNGTYYVTLMCGDPGDPRSITPANNVLRNNRMIVEGNIVNDPDGALLWDYDSSSLTVDVADGRLTIEQYLGNYNAAICFVEIRPAQASVSVEGLGPGLNYRLYDGQWSFLPDFNDLPPVSQGAMRNVELLFVEPERASFGAVFEGFIDIPDDGLYTFSTRSRDGSRLWIGDIEVADNDGLHATQTVSGDILLKAGLHPIRVETFMVNRALLDRTLEVYWAGPGFGEMPIPHSRLGRPWLYGDFFGDGLLDATDLSIFAEFWLCYDCTSTGRLDRNNDCLVNFAEFSEFASQWQTNKLRKPEVQ